LEIFYVITLTYDDGNHPKCLHFFLNHFLGGEISLAKMFAIVLAFKASAKMLYFFKQHHTLKGQNFKLKIF
jgi:hypothetical protein